MIVPTQQTTEALTAFAVSAGVRYEGFDADAQVLRFRMNDNHLARLAVSHALMKADDHTIIAYVRHRLALDKT